jgi:hypothetical protein
MQLLTLVVVAAVPEDLAAVKVDLEDLEFVLSDIQLHDIIKNMI